MISTSAERDKFKWQINVDCFLDNFQGTEAEFITTCLRCSSEMHYIAFGSINGKNIEMYFSDYDKAREVQDAWIKMCCTDPETGKYYPEHEGEAKETAEIRTYDAASVQTTIIFTDRPHLFKMVEIQPIGLKEEQ